MWGDGERWFVASRRGPYVLGLCQLLRVHPRLHSLRRGNVRVAHRLVVFPSGGERTHVGRARLIHATFTRLDSRLF